MTPEEKAKIEAYAEALRYVREHQGEVFEILRLLPEEERGPLRLSQRWHYPEWFKELRSALGRARKNGIKVGSIYPTGEAHTGVHLA